MLYFIIYHFLTKQSIINFVGGKDIMGFKVHQPTSRTEPSLNKTLRLKETMINEIQNLADEKDVSFNYLVAQMLQYCLDNLEEEKNKA